jgi:hypothetical protein
MELIVVYWQGRRIFRQFVIIDKVGGKHVFCWRLFEVIKEGSDMGTYRHIEEAMHDDENFPRNEKYADLVATVEHVNELLEYPY